MVQRSVEDARLRLAQPANQGTASAPQPACGSRGRQLLAHTSRKMRRASGLRLLMAPSDTSVSCVSLLLVLLAAVLLLSPRRKKPTASTGPRRRSGGWRQHGAGWEVCTQAHGARGQAQMGAGRRAGCR